jgi:hypothetical protein
MSEYIIMGIAGMERVVRHNGSGGVEWALIR